MKKSMKKSNNKSKNKSMKKIHETQLRYRKNAKTNLLSSPTRKIQKSCSIKKSSVSNIIWSVRRSIRGGSQLFNKRGGTYRMNENVKENGFIPGKEIRN